MKIVNINGTEIYADKFAYDGCHKIYLLESEQDKNNALEIGYQILPVEDLEDTYWNSCPLRFISTWGLETLISQFHEKGISIKISEG